MRYDHNLWQVGDFVVMNVTGSQEVKRGSYIYERVEQDDGNTRWLIRSGFTDDDFTPRKAEQNQQRFGAPHAICDERVPDVCDGIVHLLPDCLCCEGVRNAHRTTSDHTI